MPNGGENSIIWKEFLADFHSVASMAFGLHGGQTHDAGDITQRLKDFYNLNDLEEVRKFFKHCHPNGMDLKFIVFVTHILYN